jgi:hypothetical protein
MLIANTTNICFRLSGDVLLTQEPLDFCATFPELFPFKIIPHGELIIILRDINICGKFVELLENYIILKVYPPLNGR